VEAVGRAVFSVGRNRYTRKIGFTVLFYRTGKKPLYVAGAWLMSGLVNYPRLELAVVMIIVPLIFNVIQFWVQDNFLMNNDDYKDVSSSPIVVPPPSAAPAPAPASPAPAPSNKPPPPAAPGVVPSADSSQLPGEAAVTISVAAPTPRRDEAAASDVPTQSLLAAN